MHPALPRLLLAVEALGVSAAPIQLRVQGAWQAIQPLNEESDFWTDDERDLFRRIAQRMAATRAEETADGYVVHTLDEAAALDLAKDIVLLLKLAASSESPEPASAR